MFKLYIAFEQSFTKVCSKPCQSFDKLVESHVFWCACVFEGHQKDLVLESSCWGHGGEKASPFKFALKCSN